MSQVERILITQLGFLGDVILSTPIIAALRKHYPTAEFSFLTTKAAAPLLEHHPDLKEVLRYDKRGADSGVLGFFRMASILRERRFSKVFSLHRSARTSLLHAAAGIPERYGFEEARFGFLLTGRTKRNKGEHDVLRNLSLLKAAKLAVSEEPLKVVVPEGIQARIRAQLPQGAFVVLAPGSVWRTKRWTVEGFSTLARRLQEAGKEVVLVGGPDDLPAALVIERRVPAVMNLVGKLSLIESAAVIEVASAVVSNDSAPLHLASALQRPTVAIFCATVPEFGFGPWGTKAEVLGVSGLECRPCGRHGKGFCPTGTHACQRGVTVDDVFSALVRLGVVEQYIPSQGAE